MTHLKKEKQQITINLDIDIVACFKSQSISYQTLINVYLAACVSKNVNCKLLGIKNRNQIFSFEETDSCFL